MENIAISNLTMMDVAGYPVYITTGSRNRGPEPIGPSVMKDILITNIVAEMDDSMSGIQITGMPDVTGVNQI